MPTERRNAILSIIDQYGDVSLSFLCDLFPDVSSMTIRRDLIYLEERGLVVRTQGGVMSIKKLSNGNVMSPSNDENEYNFRAQQNVHAKQLIAQKALQFIKKNSSIFFDAGSTMMALAKILPNDYMNVISTGINVSQELVAHSNINVIIPGGTVNRATLSVSGTDSLAYIDKVNIECAFISASAFSLDSGFSVSNMYEAELKKKVISKAKQTIVLLDSSKIGKTLLFTFADLNSVDVLVTDDEVSDSLMRAAKEANTIII
ncbi:MAG: DeoR/GlpR transcriptional regulator [Clostridia bacterium]|nr:DeoR/GlpR transcriptional regulator [Clostridia bacterium]MBR3838642.1 DeoR/GlpR transcriptional regulator [Clostridia bacterium]